MDINQPDNDGRTALHWAAGNNLGDGKGTYWSWSRCTSGY